MLKKIEKLYRIGEVMEYASISRQTIHNYTVWGLITEARRTQGNHRLYNESVFERLAMIQEMKNKYTLAEIKEKFDAEAAKSRSNVPAE
ncbi:MAG: MerR family transcriptional regulator [Planctomycetes bacterium]|nr:MerR family transcriptional regulator [Planctomycetota bacterium]